MLPEHYKTSGHELNCNGDCEDVARRKVHNRQSDYVYKAKFIKNLQKKVLEDPGLRIQALTCELNVSPTIM